MPTSHEHLVAAEDLLTQAHLSAERADYPAADAYARLAGAHANTALARQTVGVETGHDADPAPNAAVPGLPKWCGKCDGPELAMRWINISRPGQGQCEMVRCPDCNPYAPPKDDEEEEGADEAGLGARIPGPAAAPLEEEARPTVIHL